MAKLKYTDIEYIRTMQRLIQNPAKHIRWSVLQRQFMFKSEYATAMYERSTLPIKVKKRPVYNKGNV